MFLAGWIIFIWALPYARANTGFVPAYGRAFQGQYDDLAYPEIIIYSGNLNRLLEIIENKEWNKLIEWLVDRVGALYNAGAEFAVIGSNTPHIVFDEVKLKSPIPLLSIVEETCR